MIKKRVESLTDREYLEKAGGGNDEAGEATTSIYRYIS